MAQQTAVEWLIEQITKYPIENMTDENWFGIIGQAKQMEKEHIMDAYWNGTFDMEKQDALIEAEKFYQEYYGK